MQSIVSHHVEENGGWGLKFNALRNTIIVVMATGIGISVHIHY